MSLHSARVVRQRPLHTHNRGDGMRYVMSNGVVINTQYAAKTEEEKEEVEKALSKAVWAIIDELIERGEAV